MELEILDPLLLQLLRGLAEARIIGAVLLERVVGQRQFVDQMPAQIRFTQGKAATPLAVGIGQLRDCLLYTSDAADE